MRNQSENSRCFIRAINSCESRNRHEFGEFVVRQLESLLLSTVSPIVGFVMQN